MPKAIGQPWPHPCQARLQGFPDEWIFSSGKTAAYRQVGNAFPPPVAAAVGKQILACINTRRLMSVG